MALEDDFTDILGKAQRGWNLDDAEVARRAGVELDDWISLKQGKTNEAALSKVAPVLHLNLPALSAIANGRYTPSPVPAIEGLQSFQTDFHGMKVNSHLAWDPATREAAIFDTGADARPILDFAASRGLTVKNIFLTHSHSDHVHDLGRLCRKTAAPAWVGDREPIDGARTFPAGRIFHIGGLPLETRSTIGHSRGGTTYVLLGLACPVAIVGDAVFAGSMGGGAFSYKDALATNRSEILTLPDETILCPGHGPPTTVGEQKTANPFLAS